MIDFRLWGASSLAWPWGTTNNYKLNQQGQIMPPHIEGYFLQPPHLVTRSRYFYHPQAWPRVHRCHQRSITLPRAIWKCTVSFRLRGRAGSAERCDHSCHSFATFSCRQSRAVVVGITIACNGDSCISKEYTERETHGGVLIQSHK